MAELNVNIGNLQLKNPVMTASGTFGYGVEYSDFMDISRLGGIFVKGTTIQPREGNLYPRMAETPSGMLNAVGLQNKGAQYFVDHIYPAIKDIDTHMIVNVSGSSVETYVECAEKIAELDKIPAIELGLSSDTFLADKISELETKSFLTNSDAHSLPKIAREYNRIQVEGISFKDFLKALKREDGRKILANYGMDPKLGKYHRTYCETCDKRIPRRCTSYKMPRLR